MTHEIILRIAERIRPLCPAEADKLLFCASDVQWLQRMVDEAVADAKGKKT